MVINHSKKSSFIVHLKNDLCVTIAHIPKNENEKKLVKNFAVNCVFVILHTSRWPTYLDPVLATLLFNCTVKLDDVFYTHCQLPCACLERKDMRDFYKSVRGKANTGLLDVDVESNSCLGIIQQRADMTKISLEKWTGN